MINMIQGLKTSNKPSVVRTRKQNCAPAFSPTLTRACRPGDCCIGFIKLWDLDFILSNSTIKLLYLPKKYFSWRRIVGACNSSYPIALSNYWISQRHSYVKGMRFCWCKEQVNTWTTQLHQFSGGADLCWNVIQLCQQVQVGTQLMGVQPLHWCSGGAGVNC
jgi:hypothetical protein